MSWNFLYTPVGLDGFGFRNIRGRSPLSVDQRQRLSLHAGESYYGKSSCLLLRGRSFLILHCERFPFANFPGKNARSQSARSKVAFCRTTTRKMRSGSNSRTALRQRAWHTNCSASLRRPQFWEKPYFAPHNSLEVLRRSHGLVHRVYFGKVDTRAFLRVSNMSKKYFL